MLTITIPEQDKEYLDESTSSFVHIKYAKQTLQLEHSLISLSKWEAKWCKPFLSKEEKTKEETLDYVRCMTINQNVDPNVYNGIDNEIMKKIKDYIDAPMTATWFRKEEQRPNRKVITSELIYYWMIAQNIPFECEKWHLNRLFTLLKICGEKNKPQKKMSKKEAAAQQRSLNAQRKRAKHTKG